MANKFGEEKGSSRYAYRLFPKGGKASDQNRRSAQTGKSVFNANTEAC